MKVNEIKGISANCKGVKDCDRRVDFCIAIKKR